MTWRGLPLRRNLPSAARKEGCCARAGRGVTRATRIRAVPARAMRRGKDVGDMIVTTVPAFISRAGRRARAAVARRGSESQKNAREEAESWANEKADDGAAPDEDDEEADDAERCAIWEPGAGAAQEEEDEGADDAGRVVDAKRLVGEEGAEDGGAVEGR